MVGSSTSLFLSVVSRAAGRLIAMLFRRRALISIGKAQDAMSRSVLDTKGSPRRAAMGAWPVKPLE
jgi:hypothetical protein